MRTTEAKPMHIDFLHFEHQLWLNDVRFYLDELKIYQNLLEEIAGRNTSNEVRRHIEHFQNQFIIQREQMDILKHDIKEHENWLSRFAIEHPVAIEKVAFADHALLRDRIVTTRNIYVDLKTEFKHFLTQWM